MPDGFENGQPALERSDGFKTVQVGNQNTNAFWLCMYLQLALK